MAYDPITLNEEELKKESGTAFEQDKEVVRLRTAMFYYILAALKIGLEKEEPRKEGIERLRKYQISYETIHTNIENSNHKPLILVSKNFHIFWEKIVTNASFSKRVNFLVIIFSNLIADTISWTISITITLPSCCAI